MRSGRIIQPPDTSHAWCPFVCPGRGWARRRDGCQPSRTQAADNFEGMCDPNNGSTAACIPCSTPTGDGLHCHPKELQAPDYIGGASCKVSVLLLAQTTAAVASNSRLKMLCPVLLHSSPGPLPSRHALLSLVARAWRTPSRPDSYLCVSCALAALQLRVDVSAVNEPNRGRCAARDAQGTQRPRHRTQRAVARRQRRFSLHLRRWMPAYMLAATSPRARPCPRAASRCATWRAGSQRR